MRILSTNECVYCKNQTDTISHALLECPETTNLWRQVELWLREHVEQSIKISDKEKIFGTTEKNQYTFQINMFILITKLIIYQKRPDGLKCNIYDVLRSVKNEMLADEYECEINQRMEKFSQKWGACLDSVR